MLGDGLWALRPGLLEKLAEARLGLGDRPVARAHTVDPRKNVLMVIIVIFPGSTSCWKRNLPKVLHPFLLLSWPGPDRATQGHRARSSLPSSRPGVGRVREEQDRKSVV